MNLNQANFSTLRHPKLFNTKIVWYSVSARPEFFGVIDDPLFENLGVIGKFRGSELF